jgi:hypothetical protein
MLHLNLRTIESQRMSRSHFPHSLFQFHVNLLDVRCQVSFHSERRSAEVALVLDVQMRFLVCSDGHHRCEHFSAGGAGELWAVAEERQTRKVKLPQQLSISP